MANTNAACKSGFSKTKVAQCRRQFRGKVGSDGFEKVLIGTRGAREAFLDGAERASGEEQRSDERRKTA